MLKRSYYFATSAIIIGLMLLLSMAKEAGAALPQPPRSEARQQVIVIQTQTNEQTKPAETYDDRKAKELITSHVKDVLELKNGSKIVGKLTGMTGTSYIIFNIESGEEEIINKNDISNLRKPTTGDINNFLNEMKSQGRLNEISRGIEKRREAEYGMSKETYNEEVQSSKQSKAQLIKDLNTNRREKQEEEWRRSGYGRYLKIE